jgi:endonuclease/exonuclease/phosphatase (EEP) superfamily protein YafD
MRLPRLRGLLDAMLGLATLGVVALTVAPLTWRYWPRLAGFEAVAPQLVFAAAVLGGLCLLLRLRWQVVLSIALVAWNAYLIWPEIAVLDRNAATAAAGAPTLHVLSFNLWYANSNPAATLDYLTNSGADLIGLVEAQAHLKEKLAPLRTVYPYEVDCVGAADPTCEIMLLSKYPLRNARAGRIDGYFPYVAQAEIDWNGRSVGIVMTHFNRPFMALPAGTLVRTGLAEPPPDWPDIPRMSQSLSAAHFAAYAPSLPADLIVMGDFNAPSWGADLSALRQMTGLKSSGRFLPTWPTWAPPLLRVPIDHVYTRGSLRVISINTGPDVGSDHLPVEAEIGLKRTSAQ